MNAEDTPSDAEQNDVVYMEIDTCEEDSYLNVTTDEPIEYIDFFTQHFEEKYALKSLSYPESAVAAIKALADLGSMGEIEGGTKCRIQTALTNNYIFGKIDQLNDRGIPKVHSESQLINILTEFSCNPQQLPAIRNAVYLSMFQCTKSTLHFLVNLICFAISLSHVEILNAAGTWLQQVGPLSEYSQKLAVHVVDYFVQVCKNLMKNLVIIARTEPYFAANLLTAVAEAHREEIPSDEMLNLVDAWINMNPDILTASLTYCPALPPGGILMAPIIAITGLFRWCVFGPTKQESFYYDQSDKDLCRRFRLYYEIHRKNLVAINSLKDSQGNRNVISAYDFEQIIYQLQHCIEFKLPNVSKASYDLAVQRLVEVFRIASSVGCIYGNAQKLWDLVNTFENNRTTM